MIFSFGVARFQTVSNHWHSNQLISLTEGTAEEGFTLSKHCLCLSDTWVSLPGLLSFAAHTSQLPSSVCFIFIDVAKSKHTGHE